MGMGLAPLQVSTAGAGPQGPDGSPRRPGLDLPEVELDGFLAPRGTVADSPSEPSLVFGCLFTMEPTLLSTHLP